MLFSAKQSADNTTVWINDKNMLDEPKPEQQSVQQNEISRMSNRDRMQEGTCQEKWGWTA